MIFISNKIIVLKENIGFDISIKSVDYHRGEIPLPSGTITCSEEIYKDFMKETGLNQEEAEAFDTFYENILTYPHKFGSAYIEFPAHKGFCVSLDMQRDSYNCFKDMVLCKYPTLVQKRFTQEKYDIACDYLAKIIKLMKEQITEVKNEIEENNRIAQEEHIIDEFTSTIIDKLCYSKFAEDGKNKDLLVDFVYNLLDEDFIDLEKVVNYEVTEEEIIEKIFENYDVINGKIVQKQQ